MPYPISNMINFLAKQSVKEINEKIEQSKQDGIDNVEECKEEIKESIKKVARQDTRLIAEFQSNTEEAKKLNIQLQNTQLLIQDNLKNQLEEVKEVLKESMKLRQEVNDANNKLEQEMDKWQYFSIQFLDTMERTLEHLHDHNSPSIKDIEKVIDIFSKDVRYLGIEVINPKQNEEFSYDFYEYAGEEETKDVITGKVLKCNKWGYKVNGNLYKGKRAKVIISKQIESTIENLTDMVTTQIDTKVTNSNTIKLSSEYNAIVLPQIDATATTSNIIEIESTSEDSSDTSVPE